MFNLLTRKTFAGSVLCAALLLPAGASAAQKAAETTTAETKTCATQSSAFSRLGKKLLWYIPDRCMDLVDCFSCEFGFGANIRTNLLLTKWAPLGAGAGPTTMIGWNGSRQGGIYMLKGANADFFCSHAADQDQTWIMGNYVNLTDSGKDAPLYVQQYKDPLTIGFEGGCIGNVKFMIHLSSIADFIAGIFLIDLQDDDVVNQKD